MTPPATQLYLCEKPAYARDIARVLGASTQGEGCLTGTGVVVTWCFGHLLEMAPPDAYDTRYKQWRLQDLPILPTRWKTLPKPKAVKQLKAVERAIKQASEVVIATDADREGETIAWEILARCNWRGPVRRLWLSALDDASIRKALAKLLPGDQTAPLYHAGLARGRADWLVGMNLTRTYTMLGRTARHDGVLSVGRVQTPTLRLVVDRDREIEAFKPVPYRELWAHCSAKQQAFRAKWQPPDKVCDAEDRCLDEQTARTLAQQLSGQPGRVQKIDQRDVSEHPPLPFDLGTLQQEAPRRWGMGAQQVLDLALALYEKHKATTYPRIDCPYLPESMRSEADNVLGALIQSDPTIEFLIRSADRTLHSRAWNDKKITAHHAIIPTAVTCNIHQMSEDERKLYGAIRRRYLAQFYSAHGFESTVMQLAIGAEAFIAKGRRITQPGWRVLFRTTDTTDDDKAGETQTLPSLTVGTACTVDSLSVKDCHTQPPAHFTEGTLIGAMKQAAKWVTDPRLKAMLKETSGLGTEATRAGIIKTLLERGFVEKHKRRLQATDTGCALIDALPAPVKDPATTALWEQALDDIAHGQCDPTDFLTRQSEWVRQLVARAGEETPIAASTAPQHVCPDCCKPLRRRKGKKGFSWGCTGYPDCTKTQADQRGKPVAAVPKQPLGACGCGGQIIESAKAWSCAQCKATVWKETAGKHLEAATAQALFAGETVSLNGLKSRKGKRFNASACLVNGKVKLIFDQSSKASTRS